MPMPKFNFIPEHQLNDATGGYDGQWRVSLLANKGKVKNSALYFPTEMVNVLVFGDTEKKAIGWRIIEDSTTLPDLNVSRLIHKNKQTGAVILGVGKIMKALNYKLEKTISALPVQTYNPVLGKGVINYILLPPVEIEKKML